MTRSPLAPPPRLGPRLRLRLRSRLPLRAALAALLVAALLPLQSCAYWFFSGTDKIDRSRPVALVETTGGVELGATTEYGILTLGRTATAGPCRVHYFLGPTPMVEDGELLGTGSVFHRAEIDLQTQSVRIHDRAPAAEDALVAMWTPDGTALRSVDVALARDEDGVTGDVLRDPGVELPPGAALFTDQEGQLRFVGLVSARASLQGAQGRRTFYTFAGLDRVREMLAVPEVWPKDYRVEFRPDDIIVRKPIR